MFRPSFGPILPVFYLDFDFWFRCFFASAPGAPGAPSAPGTPVAPVAPGALGAPGGGERRVVRQRRAEAGRQD